MPATHLNMRQWGPKDSENLPVLMLHGHPGSGESMEVFGECLGQERWAIAPDLRGYGKSRTNGPFVLSEHLDDLESLLAELGIDRCIVLGWSLGGILAMELALRFPERIKALILVATAARPRGSHPPISLQDNVYTAIAGVTNWMCPAWSWNINTFGKRSLFRFLIRRHTPETYRYLAGPAVSAYLQTSRHAHMALANAMRQGYDRVQDVAQLSIPTVMLAGECDRHITVTSSKETADAMGAEWVEYADTGHLFPWEVPHQVQHDIQTWLANQAVLQAV